MHDRALPPTPRRRRWLALIVFAALAHTIVRLILVRANRPEALAIVTDLELVPVSAFATWAAITTARRIGERHLRTAWIWIALGCALWHCAALVWSFREIVLGEIAPAPSWFDVPFFALAPCFAVALVFYRRQRQTRAVQTRQVADIGILTATVALLKTLVLAPALRGRWDDPYVVVAIGYPAFYVAVLLVAFAMLAGGAWGARRSVLALLVVANFAFAIVDLLYGAKVLMATYQTQIEDTLWLVGMLCVAWAAYEERALIGQPVVVGRSEPSSNAVVGAVALVALATLGADTLGNLDGAEWSLAALAVVVLAGCVALRMWASNRLEDAYQTAVAEGEATTRALDAERGQAARLRGVGSLASGTAHEVNNLLQAVAGSFALLRRRAARREDVEPCIAAIEDALARLGDEVSALRRASGSAAIVIALLPGGDPDGQLARVLSDAGYAPATLPSVKAAARASKGGEVRAIVASTAEAEQLALARAAVPVIVRGEGDLLQVVVNVITRVG